MIFNMNNAVMGKQKAAILMISLDSNKTSKIFKYLKDEEIETLTLGISSTKGVSPKTKEEVLEEFYQMCIAQEYIVEGGIGYAKEVLEKALGSDKAMEILGKLTTSLQVRPFETARKADAAQLLNFIQNEHPQTIAVILSYLRPSQSATILSSLDSDLQADIARRIAQMDSSSPEVIAQIEKEFEKSISSLGSQDFTKVGGIESIVEIISSVDRSTEKNILEQLAEQEPDLAEAIKKQMFVFEDIITLDSRSIQRVLREVPSENLTIALKGTGENVKEVILNNVSKRSAQTIREELEFMGPKRIKEIEEAQQEIVNIIRRLEESGEIIISRGSGDDIIA